MSTFNQNSGTAVPTLINSSAVLVTGNAVSSNALTVRQFGTGNVFSAQTTTGSTALFVSGSGNVGVGTTNPQTALDVFTGTMNAATVSATTLTGAGSGITALNMGNAGSGTLAVARGGTGVTSSTGSGSVVLSAGPTLSGTVTGGTFSGTHTGDGSGVTSLNMGNAGSGTLAVARGGTGVTSSTGTGSVVLSASPALSGTATFASITTSGNVGIGTTVPGTTLQVSGPANTATNRAAPYANAFVSVINDIIYGTTGQAGLEIGSGTRASGDQDRVYKYVFNAINNSTVGSGVDLQILAIPTATSSYASDGTARNRMTIGGGGNVGIGTASPVCQFHVYTTSSAFAPMCQFNYGTNNVMNILNGDNNAGWGSTGCILYVSKLTYSGRSINTSGTIATAGTDYAEYMTKTSDFTVKKGDIVGVNSEGLLTNVFTESVTFVVKSTNPSYLGGDVWGTEEALGMTKPKEVKEGDPGYAEYQTALAQFNAKLEEARIRVDRIAFSGQTPVNVTGATPGQYIVPVANADGSIGGQSVTNPTFEQYMASVGKVINILPDGRAQIIVKVV
jgi:hypothetical protein